MRIKELLSKGKDRLITNTSFGQELPSMNDFTNHKNFFDNHAEAMLVFNENYRIVAINKQLTTYLSFTKKELLGNPIHTLFESQSSLANYHVQKALQGKTTSFDIKLFDKKGQERLSRITFLPNETNDGVSVHAIIKDLTAQQIYKSEIDKLQHNLNEVQRIANIGSWEYDIKANTATLSNQFYTIYNIDKEHFSPSFKNLVKLIHPDDRTTVERLAKNAMKYGTPYEVEYRITGKNGKQRLIFHKADVRYDEKGKITHLIGTVQDITEAKFIETKLNQYEATLRSISTNLEVGMWSFDVKANQITFCTEAMEKIYGVPCETFYQDPHTCEKFVHPEDLPSLQNNYKQLKKGIQTRHQYRIIVDHQVKWVDSQNIPFFNEDGELIRVDGVLTDISEHKHLQKAVEYIANHDHLTNLPNRQFFEDKLTELIDAAREKHISFTVMSFDLDRFKYINDSLGHDVGDELLKSLSSRLHKFVGVNAFLARNDGDEFLLYIKGLPNVDDYIHLATEIRQEIENPFFIEEYELFITTSIGLSFYPFDGEDAASLLKNSDIALQKAKEFGKNNCQVFSPTMNIESFKLYTLERDLRKALINEQFFIEYQPKAETKTGRIIGAEALIRWQHEEWGKVSPLEFIHLAEETGLILKIDDWMFKSVCEQLKKWKEDGIPLVPISINISPKMFLKADVAANIMNTLVETGVKPSLIEFEITERTLIEHEKAQSVIDELKELGIKFSLDDFGTGFSSLSYLKNLNVDQLKIDKTFIDEISNDKNTEAIIKGIIYMARELDMKVVAEGVENTEQLTFLAQRECHFIQGYIFSKPVLAKEFARLVERGILKPMKTKRFVDISENRREYYRINMQFPLCSGMTIISFKGKKVSLGHSKALIEDISIGGMRFTTNVEFPVQPDIILEFKTKIMNEVVKTNGVIVWKQEIGENLYQYGLEFNISELERDHLSQMLNTFTLKMKNDPLLGGCDFHLQSRELYFV